MKLKLNHFIYFPGGDEEPTASDDTNNDSKKSDSSDPKQEKGFFQKIKSALQEWSNQDQADQEFDDTRV